MTVTIGNQTCADVISLNHRGFVKIHRNADNQAIAQQILVTTYVFKFCISEYPLKALVCYMCIHV